MPRHHPGMSVLQRNCPPCSPVAVCHVFNAHEHGQAASSHVQLPTRLAVGTGTGAGTGASTGTDGTADERRQPSIVLVDTDCVARPIGNQSINCRASTREIALALALTQPFM